MAKTIDATDARVGRLGSYVAKLLLSGEEVVILNSEKSILSGNRVNNVEKIRRLRNKGGSSLKGPKIPRKADRLLKRMIRGMLPWDRARGRQAFKQLKCYIGGEGGEKIADKKPIKYQTLGDIVKEI
ncbi:MAG: 50S ribosomal protein L13 [Candidatus Nanoarchaeia archaeon]